MFVFHRDFAVKCGHFLLSLRKREVRTQKGALYTKRSAKVQFQQRCSKALGRIILIKGLPNINKNNKID